MAQYNLDYIQPQGRYLFPAAVAVALAFALGLEELAGRALCTLLLAGGVAWLALQGAGRVATGLGRMRSYCCWPACAGGRPGPRRP